MENTKIAAEDMAAQIDTNEMTPRQTVGHLDKYIVGQQEAKKSVSIAIRNRVRRRILSEDMREDIYPKNIIMIGPTGCGKTEIARRLSKLTGAPFVKVEATKYTEVGYVGRDVESMVRDLVSSSINIVRNEFRQRVDEQAKQQTEERLLDLLLPPAKPAKESGNNSSDGAKAVFSPQDLLQNLVNMSATGAQAQAGLQASLNDAAPEMEETAETKKDPEEQDRRSKARDLMRKKLRDGTLETRDVEIDTQTQASPMIQVLSGPNMEEIDMQVQNMLGDIMPRKRKKRRVTIGDARKIIMDEELERLVDADKVQTDAIKRAEEMGIIFIDEIDKICGKGAASSSSGGPDVSREGVQRDLLPIVEGATVNTRNGPVKTDHILFIAAGAFHSTKPSDLIPELQGRFPIRVGLDKLTREDFRQILTSPRNSLTKQAQALLGTEGVKLEFTEDGLNEIADFAFYVNETTENIGARRLHTIMEKLLEEVSFAAPELKNEERQILIDRTFVQVRLKDIVESRDMSQYIL